jgi:alkylhydroperoxidase/carboxymuconolactone decarboxylase family protein YurZ
MTEHLPSVYVEFTERYGRVAAAQGELAKAVRESVPFDERTDCLLKLALAIGANAEGAVRSNVRKGLQHGLSPEDLMAVSTLAITTCGFPTAIAGYKWTRDVLSGEAVD